MVLQIKYMKKNIILVVTILFFVPIDVVSKDTKTIHSIMSDGYNKLIVQNLDTNTNDVYKFLTSAPTLQLGYLNSNKNLGSDETELIINFPIKTIKHFRIENQIKNHYETFRKDLEENLKLYVSGLVRSSLWDYKIAQFQLQTEINKITFLKQQRETLSSLNQLGDASNEILLMLDNRIIDTQISILTLENDVQSQLEKYIQITGVDVIPGNFTEQAVISSGSVFSNHPALKLIQNSMEYSQLLFDESALQNSPWNVSAIAKEVKSFDLTDKQIGIQLQVPLSRNKTGQADKTTWLQEQSQLTSDYKKLKDDLTLKLKELINEHAFLLSKQQLLEEKSKNAQQILNKLTSLKSSNEIERDLYFQRVIDLQEDLNSHNLNQLLIYKNQAMQNQVIGVVL